MSSKAKTMPATPEQPARTGRRTAHAKSSARKKLLVGDDASKDEPTSSFEDPKGALETTTTTAPGTPSRRVVEAEVDAETPAKALSAKKLLSKEGAKLKFGTAPRTQTLPEVQAMYKVVHKCTGSLGGNGSGGAIYGELTQASMQKVVDLMVDKGELNTESVFIDVGAGLGKPNLHASLEPKVKYSVGIEMEQVRWLLSLHNLKHHLEEEACGGGGGGGGPETTYSSSSSPALKAPPHPKSNCVFLHADCMKAKSFDPFTHVYMFDIGMPPALFLHMAECLRCSSTAKYVLCYHAPSLMIDRYGFEMEFIEKQATSMHGSSEGHTAYLYKCTHKLKKSKAAGKPKAAAVSKGKGGAAAEDDEADIVKVSDPLFKEAFQVMSADGGAGVAAWVASKMEEDERFSGRSSRPRTRAQAKDQDEAKA